MHHCNVPRTHSEGRGHLDCQSFSLESCCKEEHTHSKTMRSHTGHGTLGEGPSQAPVGTISTPSSMALGQDSAGSSEGKHLGCRWDVGAQYTGPAWASWAREGCYTHTGQAHPGRRAFSCAAGEHLMHVGH